MEKFEKELIEDLKFENLKLRHKLETLEDSLEKCNKVISKLTKENNKLKLENNHISTSLDEKRFQISKLKEKIKSKKDVVIIKLEEQIRKDNSIIRKLESTNKSLENSNKRDLMEQIERYKKLWENQRQSTDSYRRRMQLIICRMERNNISIGNDENISGKIELRLKKLLDTLKLMSLMLNSSVIFSQQYKTDIVNYSSIIIEDVIKILDKFPSIDNEKDLNKLLKDIDKDTRAARVILADTDSYNYM